jgi:hypothetical protein
MLLRPARRESCFFAARRAGFLNQSCARPVGRRMPGRFFYSRIFAMTTVADLSVNILANTSGFGPQVDGVRNKLAEAFHQPVGGIQELAHHMHGLEGQLRGMNALVGLGFGATVGRHVFKELHEEVVKVAEGFGDAQAHGDSFFSSLGQGVQHALGLHTAREMFNSVGDAIDASRHRLNEFDKGVGQLIERLKLGDEVVAGGLLFTADKRFAGLDSRAEFQAKQKALDEEKQKVLEMTSNENLEKAHLQPSGLALAGAAFGLDTGVSDMAKQKARLEEEQKNRMADVLARQKALEDLAEQALAKEAHDKQEKADEKSREDAQKNHQQELNDAIRERVEGLKQEGAAADRIRAQDDAMMAFKQQAAEAERLHADTLLTDDEFSARINKLQEERIKREGEEQKKKGLEPGSIGGAVEAGSVAAQHILAEARQAFAGGSPMVLEQQKTNAVLLEIKQQGERDAADKKLSNEKILIAAGVANIA